MSLNVEPLPVIKTVPDSLDFFDKSSYVVLQGPQDVTWRQIVSTSFNNSQASFTAPPPSPTTAVWRKIFLYQPVTLTFNFAEAPLGQALLQSQYDAFRAFPLASIISTLTIRYGGLGVSANLRDTTSIITRVNNDFYSQALGFSSEPVSQDISQSYSELANSTINPLGSVVDSSIASYKMGRGAFPYTTLTNPLGQGPGVPLQATVQANLVEQLMVSPQYFGALNPDSFYGLQTYDVNINYETNLSRIWSHDPSSPSILTSITVNLGQPRLDIQYLTPPATLQIPRFLTYPLFPIQNTPTDGSPLNPVLPGASTQITSSNIQFQSIPKRIYIAVKRRKGDETFEHTDTFFRITNISINYNNRSGILSSASPEALYQIALKNGLSYPWALWQGDMRFISGSTEETISGIGSVLPLDFGVDIPLHSDEAPGLNGTYNFQITVTATNTHPTDTIVPSLNLVTISEGVLTIQREGNNVTSQVGVIDKQNILDAAIMPIGVSYSWYKNNLYGGGFFKDIGKFLKKGLSEIGGFIDRHGDALINNLSKFIPLLAAGEKGSASGNGLYDRNMMLGHTGKGLITGGTQTGGSLRTGGAKRRGRKARGGRLMDGGDLNERFQELEY